MKTYDIEVVNHKFSFYRALLNGTTEIKAKTKPLLIREIVKHICANKEPDEKVEIITSDFSLVKDRKQGVFPLEFKVTYRGGRL